ncbi:hypothetical protein D3C81_1924230 [compost metagenome]
MDFTKLVKVLDNHLGNSHPIVAISSYLIGIDFAIMKFLKHPKIVLHNRVFVAEL